MELVKPGDGMCYALTKNRVQVLLEVDLVENGRQFRGRYSRYTKEKLLIFTFLISCVISPTISIVLWIWIRNWKLRRM